MECLLEISGDGDNALGSVGHDGKGDGGSDCGSNSVKIDQGSDGGYDVSCGWRNSWRL